MLSGGPTQTSISPTLAAGRPAIKTVEAPGPTIGPPTWGIGGSPGVMLIGIIGVKMDFPLQSLFLITSFLFRVVQFCSEIYFESKL